MVCFCQDKKPILYTNILKTDQSNQLQVVIVGAGLAGLAAAVSTALSGHQVTVLESAKELLEVISLYHLPHTSRTNIGNF